MAKRKELLELVRVALRDKPTASTYTDLFLGNWHEPPVMFVGINPGTTGVQPIFSEHECNEALEYYECYFMEMVSQSTDERNIWKMYKRFGTGTQRGADWLKASGACVTNLVPWATPSGAELGEPVFHRQANQFLPIFRRFVSLASPKKLVFHGRWLFDWLCCRGMLEGEFGAMVEGSQPVTTLLRLSSDEKLDIPIGICKHLSRAAPSHEVVDFVERT